MAPRRDPKAEFLARCVAAAEEKERADAAAARARILTLQDLADFVPDPADAAFRRPLSALESKYYYHGLYSKAVLVARSGTDTWAPPPADADGVVLLKGLNPIGSHPLAEVWRGALSGRVLGALDASGARWTSVDVLRIERGDLYEDGHAETAVVWIGVQPRTLSGEDGLALAMECKRLLVEEGVLDAEVEIRESVVRRY